MVTFCCVLLLSGAAPLVLAWQANRFRTLIQTVHWALAAWAGWVLLVGLAAWRPHEDLVAGRYLALALTGCTGVAVLGARRPGVGAWNFVVLGLLAVLLLPVAEGVFRGGLELEGFRLVFLGATLAVGILNYLPTRFAPAALLLGLGCGGEVAALTGREPPRLGDAPLPWLLVALTPWVGCLTCRPRAAPSEFDRQWRAFRDRYGLVWAQRLREQLNRSAHHNGWPVILRWQGLRLHPGAPLPGPEVQAEILATLRALMKRFGPEEDDPAPRPGL